MARGRLRVYLGAAPGVGKTYAMLDEGRRRDERGTDVVVAFVETTAGARPRAHGRRARGRAPRGRSTHRGVDVRPRWTSTRSWPGARRSPSSTSSPTPTCPGSRNAKRWQDVEELLDAGIDVISTVNVQHLESLNDVVEQITGVPQRETVPDAVVRARRPDRARRPVARGAAPPDGARQRLPARARSTPRCRNYFRLGNLTALRELALLWLADEVDEGLQQLPRRARHRRHLGGPRARRRRAHRRPRGRDPDPPRRADRRPRRRRRAARRPRRALRRAHRREPRRRSPAQRRLVGVARRHATTRSSATTSPSALLEFARAENATQLVLGASRRSRLRRALLRAGDRRDRSIRESGDIDVHIVTHAAAGPGAACPRLGGGLDARRRRSRASRWPPCCWPLLTVRARAAPRSA